MNTLDYIAGPDFDAARESRLPMVLPSRANLARCEGSGHEATRLDVHQIASFCRYRTQEVAGSSPASSIS